MSRWKGVRKLGFNVNIVYGNLKSENSQDNAQKPQRYCTFMNSASGKPVHEYTNTTPTLALGHQF
jgi:hypothetical protein